MIPGGLSALFAQYTLPIVFAAGLAAGGGVAWTIQSGRVQSAKKDVAECQTELATQAADAASAAIAARAAADLAIEAERSRIDGDISRGQNAVASEAAKLRRQLSELSLQADYACLAVPLPPALLDGLRRP